MSDTARIAVVDDEKSILEGFAIAMTFEGYEVATFDTGAAFLDAYTTKAQPPPDLVFLDIHMPGMSGFEVLEKAFSSGHLQRTIFTAFSGLVETKDQRWLGYFGFDVVLRKGGLSEPDRAALRAQPWAAQLLKEISQFGPRDFHPYLYFVRHAIRNRDQIISQRCRNLLAAVDELSQLRIRTAQLENQYIKKLISPKVFDLLDNEPHRLSLKEEPVAVGFADIRNFTELTNRLQIHQTNELLTLFFEHASGCVNKHQGFLDKFIGDSVMWFHHSGSLREACNSCIGAAQSIVQNMPELNSALQKKLHLKINIEAGLGVAAGSAAVGIFGAPSDRIQYSVLGPPVNLAARLCAEAPGNTVFVGGEAIEYCQHKTTSVGFLPIKGFDHEVEVQQLGP
jgi:class 3 adenylate cyclase